MGQSETSDRERLYGIAGRAAGEAALEHGRDGGRLRPATDAFVLSRIARAIVDALCDDKAESAFNMVERDEQRRRRAAGWEKPVAPPKSEDRPRGLPPRKP